MKEDLLSNSPHIIYGLIDPFSNELRYVGYTSHLVKRYSAHHRCLLKTDHKTNWIKSLLKQNVKSELIILEKYSDSKDLPQAEIELIEYYNFIGCRLTNISSGGEGLHSPTKETRLKMSEAKRGKPSPNKGIKYSEERCKEMSDIRSGIAHSEKHNKNISLGLRKKIGVSDEERSKIITYYATGKYGMRDLVKMFTRNRETIRSIINNKPRVRKRKSKSRFIK